ncbi:hypothetical protein BUALT_Bualt01G0121700 [Buddleja alternifolia]|uniref:Uncharacterized protein n=1 Tax=Buddleja alternifolia TaxID=168488 RepID=A0AAV6Y7I5_9LAMI|nr:hypothetical protein BUALT_Bualt01G0121700 [Buddleja alternifolia]
MAMSMRFVVLRLSRLMEGKWRSSASSLRYFSDDKGRILSEEERAKETVYIQLLSRTVFVNSALVSLSFLSISFLLLLGWFVVCICNYEVKRALSSLIRAGITLMKSASVATAMINAKTSIAGLQNYLDCWMNDLT